MKRLIPLHRLLEEAEEKGIDPRRILIDPKEVSVTEPDEEDESDEEE